jgi:hypothetical protein
MNLKSNIGIDFIRKTLWILFTLFIGISFSAGGVMANSCQGGPDCLNCAAAAHPRMPGMDTKMVNPGCQSADDDLDRMDAAVNSGSHPFSGIFPAVYDKSNRAHLPRIIISQFQYPDRGELTPIYLLNLSLLC